MPLMRERLPRPATRNLSRGEVLGVLGLAGSIVGWIYILAKPDPDAVLSCDACCGICRCDGSVP